MTMNFEIVRSVLNETNEWSDPRIVSAEQIESWYADAAANGDVKEIGTSSVVRKAMALEAAGLIILGSPQ